MGWKTEQVRPSSAVVAAVVDRAIRPAVEATRDRVQIAQIIAQISTWVLGEAQLESRILLGTAAQEPNANAHIRLRFRRTFKPERSLFFAQLRMDVPDEKTGFAGLIVKGEVKTDADEIAVSTTTCTVIYNQCSWIDPASV